MFDYSGTSLLDDGAFHCYPAANFRAGLVSTPLLDASGDVVGWTETIPVDAAGEQILVEITAVARGDSFDTSAVEIDVDVTNDGASPIAIGGRWAWLVNMLGYINFAWSPCDPCLDDFWLTQEEEYFSPFSDHLVIADNNRPFVTPSSYFAALTLAGPWTLSPPPTQPDRIAFGFDPQSLDPADRGGPFSTCYEWHPRPDAPTAPPSAPRGPEAMGYWWGDTPATAIPLAPGQSVRFTVWEWAYLSNPVHADAGAAQVVECAGSSTTVALDAGASYSEGGSALMHRWSCADPSVTFDDPRSATPIVTLPGVGRYEITLDAGVGPYTAAASKVIDVVDTTAPSVTVDAPITLLTSVLGRCGAVTSRAASATDSCATPTIVHVTAPDIGSGGATATHDYPLGTTTIRFTATDPSGNAAQATTQVTVIDDVAPALVVPPPVVRRTSSLRSCADSEAVHADASDDCGGVTVVHGTAPDIGSGDADAFHDYPLGTTTIRFAATDGSGNASTSTTTVTVIDDVAPVLSIPAPVMARTSALGACSASLSPTATAIDDCGSAAITHVTVPDVGRGGAVADHVYPLGVTRVVFTAIDPSGNASTSETTVTVVDDVPPRITRLAASPSLLWPTSHELREVAIDAGVADDCDPEPGLALASALSSEPDDATGDGRTSPDVDAAVGTDARLVRLRAERDGAGPGRTYSLTYRATDASGNASEDTVQVLVPHDRSR